MLAIHAVAISGLEARRLVGLSAGNPELSLATSVGYMANASANFVEIFSQTAAVVLFAVVDVAVVVVKKLSATVGVSRVVQPAAQRNQAIHELPSKLLNRRRKRDKRLLMVVKGSNESAPMAAAHPRAADTNVFVNSGSWQETTIQPKDCRQVYDATCRLSFCALLRASELGAG